MGSSNSSRRHRMAESEDATTANLGEEFNEPHRTEEDDGIGSEETESEPTDLQAILAYLIRSGQVRILTQGGMTDDEDEDDCEFYGPVKAPKADPNPDTSLIEQNDIKQQIIQQSGRGHKRLRVKLPTIPNMLQCREIGSNKGQMFTGGDRKAIGCQYLPNHKTVVANYHHKAFCGTYSIDGNIFLNASQDQNIRIYDTSQGKFDLLKTIRARDVGWSILDTAFSPDGNYMVYSSWSDCIHLCSIHGDHDTHMALHLFPGDRSFCIFSLTFSSDNQEILGGANDGCLYVFDRESNQRTLKIDAHDDDVNAVSYADSSSHILFSGADDGLVKAWDRRTLREDRPEPIATLAGHGDGITFIDTKGDGRYLLSNSKDQTIKLWDIRKTSPKEAIEATKRAVAKQRWDYRWQKAPSYVTKMKKLPGDSSLMTYVGHSIRHTLIRCRFSPEFTTGQRYVYTGCATGNLVVYDLLTGKIVSKLNGHRACVRDVSWHPYENTIITTSWDGSVGKWDYLYKEESDLDTSIDTSSSEDSDSDSAISRRTRASRGIQKLPKNCPKECLLFHHHGLFE